MGGCELLPAWAGGALLLLPLTAAQVGEDNLSLHAHNIVCLQADVEAIERALMALPCKKRPKLKPEHQAQASPLVSREGRTSSSWERSANNQDVDDMLTRDRQDEFETSNVEIKIEV